MNHSDNSEKKPSSLSIMAFLPAALTAAMLISALIFLLPLRQLNVLSTGLFIAAVIVLIALILFFSYMMRQPGRKNDVHSSNRSRLSFVSVLGMILSLLLCTAALGGGIVLRKTLHTLQQITTVPEVVVNDMVVYVRSDDPAASLNDTVSYSYGIMETHNRDISDAALKRLNEELSVSLSVSTYEGPVELVESLLDGEVNAILFSPLYFELLSSEGSFGDLPSQVRILSAFQVETVVIPAVVPQETSSVSDDNSTSDTEAAEPAETEPEPNPNILTIYLSGVDAYSDINGIANGDVNIIATINKETHQILLISTPRDSYVELAGQDGQFDKLTHAAYYGIDSSMATLEKFYGVDIDYYVRVNFWGLASLVNVLGGIDIFNPYDFKADAIYFEEEPSDGYIFYRGDLHLNGAKALSYARTRHDLPHGDMSRGDHQMIVIRGILDKMLSPAVLNDVDGFLTAVGRNLITNIPSEVLTELVKEQLASNPEWELVSYAPYGEGEWNISFTLGNLYTATVVLYPETVETAKQLMMDIREDKIVSVPENAR